MAFRKKSGNWFGAGHPHPRDGIVTGTFTAFAAARGRCVHTGFGSEHKMMRPGIAAINLLVAQTSQHLPITEPRRAAPFAQAGLQLPLAQEVP